jgi:HSP20 family molecular chaperone IbpA
VEELDFKKYEEMRKISLFDMLFYPDYYEHMLPLWSDIRETGKELFVELAVPGHEKEDFILSEEDGVLLLEIKRRDKDPLKYSIISRRTSGEYDFDKGIATYKAGILSIKIPKRVKQKALPKHVIGIS